MATCLGSLFSRVVGREAHCKQILLACVGGVRRGWPTLRLLHVTAACTSWAHTAQAPGCSARALSQVGPAFHALPRSKLLGFLGPLQRHRPRWAVYFVPFPGPSCSGDQVFLNALSQVGPESYVSLWSQPLSFPGVPCVSSGELISGCDTPGRCEPSRIPGRRHYQLAACLQFGGRCGLWG